MWRIVERPAIAAVADPFAGRYLNKLSRGRFPTFLQEQSGLKYDGAGGVLLDNTQLKTVATDFNTKTATEAATPSADMIAMASQSVV